MTEEDSKLARMCYKLVEKSNSNKNFGVQRVQNRNNSGIPSGFPNQENPILDDANAM
jgi:hypothetical protein